jgi:hypothetical protein
MAKRRGTTCSAASRREVEMWNGNSSFSPLSPGEVVKLRNAFRPLVLAPFGSVDK